MSNDYAAWGLTATATGSELRVRVVPRASRNAILGPHDGATRLALTAPPVEGAANAALLTYLADLLCLPKRNVTLISGQSSRSKLVRIEGITIDKALAILQAVHKT
jgi:uncharacterized protein (TIGR00251 family)